MAFDILNNQQKSNIHSYSAQGNSLFIGRIGWLKLLEFLLKFALCNYTFETVVF